MKKNKTSKMKNKWRIPFLMFCIIPPLIQFVIFYVYTNLSSILMAFTDRHGVIGMENFIRFFDEFSSTTSDIRIAFRNTFLTFGLIIITYPLKVLVSYFIYKKVPFYGFYRIVFFLPSIIFSVALNIIFTHIIGPEGALAQWIGDAMDLEYAPELLSDSRFANTVILSQLMWLSIPGDIIIWGGTFARIPTEVLESGYIDGTNWWTEFTRIIVPLVWPTVSLQIIMNFCSIFSATGNVFLLTKGDYGTMTLSAWMYRYLMDHAGARYSSNAYNYLAAVGLLLTIVAILIATLVRKIMDKHFQEVEF